MRFFTPTEYVEYCLYSHPTLYSASVFDVAKFRILDHLLNVIGNGISDPEELREKLAYQEYDREKALRYIGKEPLYYGYHNVTVIGEYTFPDSNSGSGTLYGVLESEKINHPDVKKWVECEKIEHINPYPNFSKAYSTLYRTDILSYGNEWREAIKWFYMSCLEYFKGNCSGYSYAFPCAKAIETEYRLRDMKKRLTQYESNEEVSAQYNHPFNGNVEDFLTSRWEEERNRIINFIEESLKLLTV